MPLLFVRVRGPYAEASVAAWTALLSWVDKKDARSAVHRAFGLNRDHVRAPGLEGRYDACIEAPLGLTEDIAAGIGMQILPGGAYGRHRHGEGRMSIGEAFTRLEFEWAPSRGMSLDTNRPLVEAYLSSDPLAADARMDLCLPVSTASRRTAA